MSTSRGAQRATGQHDLIAALDQKCESQGATKLDHLIHAGGAPQCTSSPETWTEQRQQSFSVHLCQQGQGLEGFPAQVLCAEGRPTNEALHLARCSRPKRRVWDLAHFRKDASEDVPLRNICCSSSSATSHAPSTSRQLPRRQRRSLTSSEQRREVQDVGLETGLSYESRAAGPSDIVHLQQGH